MGLLEKLAYIGGTARGLHTRLGEFCSTCTCWKLTTFAMGRIVAGGGALMVAINLSLIAGTSTCSARNS